MDAYNLTRDGKPLAKQLVLTDGATKSLKSYDTIVVRIEGSKVYLDPAWKISATTLRAVNIFLGTHGKADIVTRIGDGTYTVKNLNK